MTLTAVRALVEAGQLDEAAVACRDHLARDVADPAALHLLGLILLRQGNAAEAVPLLTEAAERGADAVRLSDLAEALNAIGLTEEAETRLRAAIALGADFPEPYLNLGSVLLARGAAANAVAPLRRAVALRPEMAEAHFALGTALWGCGKASEAEDAYRAAVTFKPDYTEAHNNLGNVLLARHSADAAAACYRAALQCRPDAPELLLGLGNALLESGDAEAAETTFRAAMAKRPDYADAAANLGNALVAQLRTGEACDAFADAVRLDPGNPDHRYNRAHALLLNGRFEEGWCQHEARRDLERMREDYVRRPELPRWQPGTALEGRHVLVMMEQGYGDQIQFLRYVPLLAARGVDVTVEVPRDLQPVFPALRDVARVIAPEDDAPGCTVVCPLMSLPLYFGTTLGRIPGGVPYAVAPPGRRTRWRKWLGPRRGTRIGLVCAGRESFSLDRRRSMPLSLLAPLLDVGGCEFILLHKDLRPRDEAALAAHPGLRWPAPEMRDFGDTAALLAELDVLISTDTAVPHLAGALGRPVLLMLPFVPDWRWLLGRRDSPWYPTVTLYRQPRPGDWQRVIEAVSRDAAAYSVCTPSRIRHRDGGLPPDFGRPKAPETKSPQRQSLPD